MPADTILIDDTDGVRTITLNRPEKLNAFTAGMATALAAALAEARAPSVRAVLLTGAGKAFSAGQDLAEIATPDGQPSVAVGDIVDRLWNPLVKAVRTLDKPIVCAVNGVAAGASANIALGCDIVLAARSAKFIQPFSKLGLIPDGGGTYFLPRLIGRGRATALAMLGEPVSAEQAEAWGMIWKAVDDAALMPEARALAVRLAAGPTFAFGLVKRAMRASSVNDLDTQLDLERELQRIAGESPDYREGLAAFLGKRTPRFTGRSE